MSHFVPLPDRCLNVPKDFLGQAGQSIGVPELLRLDTCHCELRLDEAEPDNWFLLIIGAKLDLGGSCRHDGQTFVSFRHALRKFKREGSQSNGRELFPRRMKEQRSHYENGVDKENGTQKQG